MDRHGFAVWQLLLLTGSLLAARPQVAVSADKEVRTDLPSDVISVGCEGDFCADTACKEHHSTVEWSKLSGNWLGPRPTLADCGLTFRGTSTHYVFGIDGGITMPVPPPLERGNAIKYTGRERYNLTMDLPQFGTLERGTLNVRGEIWYGEYGNVGFRSGAFAPPIFPTVLPPDPSAQGVPKMTGFFLTQPLSDQIAFFAGKNDVLGNVGQDLFAGGDGTQQFMNQALMVNPAFLLAMPYTHFTLGAVLTKSWGKAGLIVYDAKDRTRDFFRFDDLFSEGIIVLGQIEFQREILGKPGQYGVGVTWKHLDLPDLRFGSGTVGDYPYEDTGGGASKSDAYVVYCGFDQYLCVYSREPVASDRGRRRRARGFGIFGRASITDGNPNPVKYFLSFGIGGDNPWEKRCGDTFGVGWYYNGASNEFGSIPRMRFGPRDGTGIEVFYNVQVKQRLNITPDFQYIRPGAGGVAGDAFILGMRVTLTL